jgi:hypothetical protein
MGRVRSFVQLPFQRGVWWLAKRFYQVQSIKGIEFMDMRPDRRADGHEVLELIGQAIDWISTAKAGFGELVTSHLRLVVAMPSDSERALPTVRIYVSPFEGHERRNSQYLACRLIWAATYIRLARDADARRSPRDEVAIQRACYDAQVRFAKQFEGWEEWVEYLS